MDVYSHLLHSVGRPTFLALLGFSGVAGLIAVVSPRRFKSISQGAGHWFDTNRIVAFLDRPFQIDTHILRHTRLFGVAVMLAVAVLASVYFRR